MAGLRNAVRAVTPLAPVRRHPLRVWAVVLVLLLAGAGWLWWLDREHEQVDAARHAALAAARKHTADVLSYNHGTVEEDLQRARNQLTGGFREEFAQLTTDLIAPAATKDEITTKADVSMAGVVDAAEHEVTTLLFVNQTTRSRKLTEPKIDGSRIEVTMRRVGDRWLIARLTPL